MLGAAVAHVAGLPPASFALVGMAAAFAGAARVPIATLLMVTEMTGGYQLLVPAAATVMLSYLVQTALSPWLRYRTLYEAQVPGRVESGAHAADYLHGVLKLLTERKLSVPQGTAHLDLWTLLEDGLPVDLGEGKQLWAGTVGSGPLARRPLAEVVPPEGGELEVIAVLREEHTLLPHPELVLRTTDRLIAIGTLPARPWFEEAVRPLRSWSRGGSSPDHR
jgi:CIC family chloride channel protein